MGDDQARGRLREIENQLDAEDVGNRSFITLGEYVRRRAAIAMIAIYGLVLVFALVIFTLQGIGCSAGKVCAWDNASANAIELVKIGIMPVITLVIGYYFGRKE